LSTVDLAISTSPADRENIPRMARSMPDPLSICLEDLDLEPEDDRYLQCVALPGGEPGLSLDRRGRARWMHEGMDGNTLWVSADGRLALEREAEAAAVQIHRAGRALKAPRGKPVMLLDQDLLHVAGRRLRVHVHGEAEVVHPPEPLSGKALARLARSAAAAVALGAMVGAGGAAGASPTDAPIEVRTKPPKAVRVYSRICTITAVEKGEKGGLLLTVQCPKEAKLKKGKVGEVLAPGKTSAMKGAQVTVVSVKGTTVTASTPLSKKQLGKASKVRFMTR